MMTAPQAPVKTMIRLLDDHAIVPSSTGKGCYHVAFEDGVSVHCTCPDHARRSRVCKHMTAVDAALKGEAERGKGRDTYHVELTPKAAPKRSAIDGVRAEVGRLMAQDAERQASLTNAKAVGIIDDEDPSWWMW